MLQGVDSNFHIDILRPLVEAVAEVCRRHYEPATDDGRRMRLAACRGETHALLLVGTSLDMLRAAERQAMTFYVLTLAVVLPHAAEAEAFVDDFALFSEVPALLLPAGEDFGTGGEEPSPEDVIEAERLAVVKRLAMPDGSPPPLVVTSIQAILAPLVDPRAIEAGTRRLAVGGTVNPEELAEWLAVRGWQPADAIDAPGSFARRGGIVHSSS
jgi:transcription-repair coupling factor (superfamily II helicase)